MLKNYDFNEIIQFFIFQIILLLKTQKIIQTNINFIFNL
jgi:hypothetical protein